MSPNGVAEPQTLVWPTAVVVRDMSTGDSFEVAF